ncbi:GGDEF domain-containing protein [Deinococcus irradiatisoli]|uniref:GGDEF domain-containing protein n=2 Tax=Deinococcus irradiatisoli TaxID=2202254 RepID=A0A2Z3JH58_9DEIO|nr:GGDEF domain-containing protein [Deinococcus irradiatisoli]
MHRDAVYIALDLGDAARAMTHALSCLDLARACADGPLQVKAHVALALVQAESYDDLGADEQFRIADQLARECRDDRGVALIAVNTSHYELERGNYAGAAAQLLGLLRSDYLRGLILPAPGSLLTTFHINFVVGAAETLLAGGVPFAEQRALVRQLRISAAFLRRMDAARGQDTSPLEASALLDALTRAALWEGDIKAACRLADEHVRLAGQADVPLLYGRALLDRSGVQRHTGDLEAAIHDAEQAVAQFQAAGNGLWESRAHEALAEAYASAGRFEAAFQTQRAVTRGVERLFRDYHQQRALVGQIAQQAREAEVRAQALAQAALRDPLTGAPNRTQAMQVMAERHRQASGGEASAIALMDLDHFKRVNDTYGHLAGDSVLIEVIRLLTAELRPQDLLARLGGEEFVVIFAETTLSEAARRCEQLRQVLRRATWESAAPGLSITGSFGLAALDARRSVTAALQAADSAMYAAKASGRNAVCVEPELLLEGA